MRDTTVVIVLGGSDFTNAELGKDEAFSRSANALKEYLLRADGFDLASENLLDRFDSPKSPSEIDSDINDFLVERKMTLAAHGEKIDNVLIYYTGHGQFAKPSNDYVLALPYTRRKREGSTAYRVVNLATTIRENARHARRFVLLDCCFAASAYHDFQSGTLDVVDQQTQEAFARAGTSLLCAAAPKEPAVMRVGNTDTESGMTVFSESLINVLNHGIPEIDRQLVTLSEVGYAVEEAIKARFASDAPRPQIKSPDEREGDVSRIPLFPNRPRIRAAAATLSEQVTIKFARAPSVPSNDPIVVALEEAGDPIGEDLLLGVERHVTVTLAREQVDDLVEAAADIRRADIDIETIRERGADVWACLESAQPALRMVIESARDSERPQPVAWTGKSGLLSRIFAAIQIACLDETGDERDFVTVSCGAHYFHPLRLGDTARSMQRRQGKISQARVGVKTLSIEDDTDDVLRRLADAATGEVAIVATSDLHSALNRTADLVRDDSPTRVMLGFGEYVTTAEALEALVGRVPAVSIGGHRLASKELSDALRRHLPKLLSNQSVAVALKPYRNELVRHSRAENDGPRMRDALCWTTWSWIGRPLFAAEFGVAYAAEYPHLMSLRSIASREWYFDREAGIPKRYRAQSLIQSSDDPANQFHLYLTGSGGTGKSCFLRYVYETIDINQPDVLPVWYKVDAPSSEWEDVVRRVKEEVVNALARRIDRPTAEALTDERKDLPFYLRELVENLNARKLPIRRVALFIDQLERTFESGESPELYRLNTISKAFTDLLSKIGTGKGIRVFIASRKQYLPDFLSSYEKAAEYNLHFNVLQRIAGDEQIAFVQRVLGWCREKEIVSVRLDPEAAKEVASASDGHPLETMLALIQLFSHEHKGAIGRQEVEQLKPWEKIFHADEQLAAKDDIDWYFFLGMAHARTEIVRFEEVWWRLRLVKPELTRRVNSLGQQGVLERMWLFGHLGRTVYPRPLDDDAARYLEFFHANMRDHLIGSVMSFGGEDAERSGRRGGTPAVWRALDRLAAAARDWKQSQQLLLREDIIELMQHKDVLIEPIKGEGSDRQVESFFLLFLRDNKDDRDELFEAAKQCFVYSAVVHDVLGRWAFRTLYRNVADQVDRCRAWLRQSDSASRIRLLQFLVELRDGRADTVLADLVIGQQDPAPRKQLADILAEPLFAARYRRAFVWALLRHALDRSPNFPTQDEVTTRFGEFLAQTCSSDRDELLALLEALAQDVAILAEERPRRAIAALLADGERLYGWISGQASKAVDLTATSRALHHHVPPRIELRAGKALRELLDEDGRAQWRGKIEARIGLPVPDIVLTDGEISGAEATSRSEAVRDHELELRIDGRITALGEFYPGQAQTLRRHWDLDRKELPVDARLVFNEALEESVVWLPEAELDALQWERSRATASQAVFEWLNALLRRNVAAVFTFYDLMPFLSSLEQLGDRRFDLRELIRTVSGNFAAVWRILIDLARERVPLGELRIDLLLELQELVRQMGRTNTVLLSQKLREHVGFSICREFTDASNQLPVLLLDADLEQSLVRRLQIGDERHSLALSPEEGMTVAAAVRAAFEDVLRVEDTAPVLVCEDALRKPIQDLVQDFDPRIYALSYTELSPEIRPESKGAVTAMIDAGATASGNDAG
jgi:hypothetical protein